MRPWRRENRRTKYYITRKQEVRKISYMKILIDTYSVDELEDLEMENERIPGYEDPDGHIDLAETKNNYHLVYPKGSYMTLISPYIYPGGGGKRQKGSIVSVVVSADEEYFELRGDACEREFFKDAAQFFIDRYTLKNVFSAVVHVDEGLHHMHVNFLPYDDEGKLMPIGQGDRDAMRELHDDLYEAVGRRWNLEKGKTTTEWKR